MTLRASLSKLGALAGSALLLSASVFAQPEQPALNEAIVARVNGKPILLSQLKETALDLDVPLTALTTEGLRGEGFRKAITRQIDDELLVQEARKEEIKPDDLDISRRVDAMIKRLIERSGGQQAFSNFLASSHLGMESLRKLLLDRLTRQDLASSVVAKRVRVGAEEIEAFTKKRREAGEDAEEVNLAQIFIQSPKDERATSIGKERLKLAVSVARQAGKDPQTFPKLAADHSDDPASKERGGLLGWVGPSALQPPLRERVATLQPNEVSEPVTTDTGYHVLYLIERRNARELLFGERFDAERAKLLESLRTQAAIEIYPLQ